jgi:hypothetical protein
VLRRQQLQHRDGVQRDDVRSVRQRRPTLLFGDDQVQLDVDLSDQQQHVHGVRRDGTGMLPVGDRVQRHEQFVLQRNLHPADPERRGVHDQWAVRERQLQLEHLLRQRAHEL